MNRRTILQYTAAVTGAVVCTPLAASLLSGCQTTAESGPGEGLAFFTTEEMDLITRIVDAILPRTDSPSASDAGVPQIIDQMVGKVYPKEASEQYRIGFQALSGHIEKKDLSASLVQIEKGTEAIPEEVSGAYRHLKQQTIAYYLSTEQVGKNFLNYLPVPGEYQACITLEEAGGKAWAL